MAFWTLTCFWFPFLGKRCVCFFRMFGVCVCVKYQRWLVLGDQGLTREVLEQLRFKKQRHQEVGTKKGWKAKLSGCISVQGSRVTQPFPIWRVVTINHQAGVCAARKLLSLEFGGKLENFHRIPWDTNLLFGTRRNLPLTWIYPQEPVYFLP